ncbi:MAG: hypothetical protein WC810_02635 [Janthinobacterium sp.]
MTLFAGENKKANPKVGFLLSTAEFLVARGGIEPPTQGFSILTSRLLLRHRLAGLRFSASPPVWHGSFPIQHNGNLPTHHVAVLPADTVFPQRTS